MNKFNLQMDYCFVPKKTNLNQLMDEEDCSVQSIF